MFFTSEILNAGLVLGLCQFLVFGDYFSKYKITITESNLACNLEQGNYLPPGQIEINKEAVVTGYLTDNLAEDIASSWWWGETPEEIVLEDSMGGYIDSARALGDSGIPIRITGTVCTSACAMILIESSDACVDESVETINFHSFGHYECRGDGLTRVVNQELTQEFISKVRQPLQDRIAHLSEVDAFQPISLAEFLAVYPEKSCQKKLSRW